MNLSLFFENWINWLKGKKTIIGSIALFIAGGLLATGAIDQKTFEVAASIIAAWTAMGLHSAIVNK